VTFHIEEKTANSGLKFPSAFVKITEMIPKNAEGGGKTQYVPKTQSKAANLKAKAEEIRNNFSGNKG
jgi:hypothetical protein